jgi:hypothetical protein
VVATGSNRGKLPVDREYASEAEPGVSGSNPGADLHCYLYEGQQLVEGDNGYAASCTIRWTQKVGGAMTLRVRNVGAGTVFETVDLSSAEVRPMIGVMRRSECYVIISN